MRSEKEGRILDTGGESEHKREREDICDASNQQGVLSRKYKEQRILTE